MKTETGELVKSLIFGSCLAMAWLLFWNDYESTFVFWVLSTLLSLAYFGSEKERRKKEAAKNIEAKLPLALLEIATDLEAGNDFEKSITEIAKSGKDELASAMQKALANYYSTGAQLDECIIEEALKTGSKDFLQAASRLSLVYRNSEGKKSGMPLKKTAFEIIAKQKNEVKEFTGKAQSISVAFIASSAVLPSLLLAFAGIGSVFMEMPFTETQFFLITCLAIPLINSMAIVYFVKSAPVVLRRFE